MFLIDSEAALTRAFRPRDQRALELPPGLIFPLFVRDYLSWVEPTGVRAFVVLPHDSGRPLGLCFRRDQDKSGGGSHLCDWCHQFGPDVSLLTAEKNSKRRLGVWLCRELNCAAKLDQAADLSGTSSVGPKRLQLERMRRFAEEGLGIEQVP